MKEGKNIKKKIKDVLWEERKWMGKEAKIYVGKGIIFDIKTWSTRLMLNFCMHYYKL